MKEIWIHPTAIVPLQKRVNRLRKHVSDIYIISAANVSKEAVKNIREGKRIKKVHAEKLDQFLQSQNY